VRSPPKSLRAFTYEKGLYALPKDIGSLVIFYNKDLFDKAGVPYPDKTWTWDTLIENGRRLTKTDSSGRPSQFGFLAYRQIERWAPFVYQNGGRIFDENGERCLLDKPEAIEAVQFFTDLFLKHHIMPTISQSQAMGGGQGQLFESGKVAMIVDGRWMVPQYSKAKFAWDVAHLPKMKERGTFTHVSGYVMSSRSKHKSEAWRLLKYLTGRKVQTSMTEKGLLVPARKSIAASDVFLTPDVPPAHDEVFLEATEYGHLLFTNPFMRRDEDVRKLEDMVELIFLGRIKPGGAEYMETIRKINERKPANGF
jgi:multiple sugar transport system substrate-binding protein